MELTYEIHDFYNLILNQYKCKDNTENILICLMCKKQCYTVLKIPVSIYDNILIIDGVCCGINCINKILKSDEPKFILTKNILIFIFFPIF